MFTRSLALGTVAVALLSSSAIAADLIIPTAPQPIYEAAGFSWDGLYAGVQGGGLFYPAPTNGYGIIGAHVGVNFTIADPILLGLEGTAEYLWDGAGNTAGQYFLNARLGVVATDQVMFYAIGGAGIENFNGTNNGIYQLGAGVELAVTDSISIDARVTGLGFFDPAVRVNFFDGARATVGVSYHF